MVSISSHVLGLVADILVCKEDDRSEDLLRNFNDFVEALSADSGLPELHVQSLLIERLLEVPEHQNTCDNVIRLDDYLQLIEVN